MDYITIFTPTYNRSKKLFRLFESLENQTDRNFEWLIVDDGSIDETNDVVKDFIEKADFPIKYIRQNNQGKHVAINTGVMYAKYDWFFIVDSDDYLTCDAINLVNNYLSQIRDNPDYAGVVGLRGNYSGNTWNKWFNETKDSKSEIYSSKYFDATCIDYRFKRGITGDRAEVVRTSLLRKYPFPVFEGEKFIAEGYFWFSLAKDGYLFRWFNDVIYVTEYLEDGLTQNVNDHLKNSPRGEMELANLLLSCGDIPFIEYIRYGYRYYRYGLYAGNNVIKLISNCNNKLITLLALPLAMARPLR